MPLTLDEYMLRTKEFYRNKGYGFNRDNMEKILSVSNNSMECHSRVFAFRVDFHFPKMDFWEMVFAVRPDYGGVTIKAFAEELNKLIVKEIGNIAKLDAIRFVPGLPKTRSGKIMRRILRSIAKKEPITQDISTLEDPSIVEKIQNLIEF